MRKDFVSRGMRDDEPKFWAQYNAEALEWLVRCARNYPAPRCVHVLKRGRGWRVDLHSKEAYMLALHFVSREEALAKAVELIVAGYANELQEETT